MPRLFRVLFRAALIAFVLLEVLLRLGGYTHDVGKTRRNPLRVSEHADLGYDLKPGVEGWAWLCDVRVNSLGTRGPEPPPPPAGRPRAGVGALATRKRDADGRLSRRRIAFLGDSVTFGVFNQEATTIPVLTAAAMAEGGRGADPQRVGGAGPSKARREHRATETAKNAVTAPRPAVLNAGIPGYDIVQEAAFYRRRVAAWKPTDLVVLFGLNDAGVAVQDPRFREKADRWHNSPMGWSRCLRLAFHIAEIAHLSWDFRARNHPTRFAKDYADKIAPIDPDEHPLANLRRAAKTGHPVLGNWFTDLARVGRIRWAFEDLAAATKRDGVQVYLAVYPWLGPEDPYPFHRAHDVIRHEATRAGFTWIDLMPDLLQGDPNLARWAHFSDDPFHLSADGNRRVAKTLARRLARPMAVPPRASDEN